MVRLITFSTAADPEAFIARWTAREGGAERANYALFLTELCDLIGAKHPDPAGVDTERNDYVFERGVRFRHDDGHTSTGRIDLYKKGCFVLEAKQSRIAGREKAIAGQTDLFIEIADERRGRRSADRTWDVLMMNAKRQAEEYARALPVSHGWPPFILVCDVGHCIEVYADFSGQGKNYTQFPDRQGFRIYLEDLRKPDIREWLAGIWTKPHSLDPSRVAAKVTREIAERLAAVSKALEAKNYDPEDVAHFLMRCLFTMFAADMRLLPENAFRDLLADCKERPENFVPLLTDLWKGMNDGVFAASIRTKVLHFNGNLFRDATVLPLGREGIGELAAAASKSWRDVEPAIFGTLLEQALDPEERRRLGAHYTPRAYVERLVVATVIEPLRDDWRTVQATAETLRAAGDSVAAAKEVRKFHETLCATRVLDPACGTGNFLYVAMELMKKLEGEVLEALLDLGGQEALTGLGRHTIDPHQFLGLELNPRAAAIAELVIWIGYLQSHFRTKGGIPDPPILKAFHNIEIKNAVLTWEGYPIPKIVDARETYPNPHRPMWPAAEFIVGNPPFIAGQDFRRTFGDEYAETLWKTYRNIPGGADHVMFWWDRAAGLLTQKGTVLRRFGLVTTNSITQEFSGRVVARRLKATPPISLVLAIPNHPWTKVTKRAAAVRIAMTVCEKGEHSGWLRQTVEESQLDTDDPLITFAEQFGRINPNLTIGTDVSVAVPLTANEGICHDGVKLHGKGFVIKAAEAQHLGLGLRPGLDQHIRPYLNGRDINQNPRRALVIDLYGLGVDEVRSRFPEVYQHLLVTVKPVRDKNNRASYRDFWWIFGEPRRELRQALIGCTRFIATVDTATHRIFQFMPIETVCDDKVVIVAFSDSEVLGVLSSRIHVCWSLAQNTRLGQGDDPVYVKSRCFAPFPFPDFEEGLRDQIRGVAEELDAHRKARQQEHPGITLTQMYNVLERLRAIEANTHPAAPPLTSDEEQIRDQGLILILKELHESLDALVFRAYGWPDTLTDEEIVARLVALNRERAEEEERGLVRWLRPEYQIRRFAKTIDKQAAEEAGKQVAATLDLVVPSQKPLFPANAVEQTAAVFAALVASSKPVDATAMATTFRQGKRVEKKITAVLQSLARLGHVATRDGRSFVIHRAA